MLIEEKFILEDKRRPQGLNAQMCKELKSCKSAEEIKLQEPKEVGEYFVCTAPLSIVNQYMKNRFNSFGVYSFLGLFIYAIFEEMAVLPITAPNIVLVLRKENMSKNLVSQFYQDAGRIADPSVYMITLVEAAFPLAENQDSLPGIWHETKEHRYLIDGASQTELVVFFEPKSTD